MLLGEALRASAASRHGIIGIAAFNNVSADTIEGGCGWLKPTDARDARRE